MTSIAILILVLFLAAVACCLTARSVKRTLNPVKRKPSAKILKMQREYQEMLDYKLSIDYAKTKSL